MILAAVAFGAAIGLSVGLLGGGGSVLAVPVLVYVLGQSVHQATTASLVVVTGGALAGGIAHHRAGRVCWRHAAIFTVAAVPGIFAGTSVGDHVADQVLIGAFSAVMAAAALLTWRKAGNPSPAPHVRPSGTCPPLRIAKDAAAGLAIGFMTGFFGVGGGFLIVPMLAIGLAFSMRLAVGTSLAIIAATSAIGLVAHLAAGRAPDPGITVAMTAACVVAAVGAASFAGRVPQRRLGRGFALLVATVAAYLFISAAFLGGPPGAS